MVVEFDLSHVGQNKGLRCSKTGCGGRHLVLRGTREQSTGENYTIWNNG